MQRKRRKSEETEDKRACISPSVFPQTSVLGLKEQQQSAPRCVEQWDINDVVSFLSRNGFDDYTYNFQGILNVSSMCIVLLSRVLSRLYLRDNPFSSSYSLRSLSHQALIFMVRPRLRRRKSLATTG